MNDEETWPTIGRASDLGTTPAKLRRRTARREVNRLRRGVYIDGPAAPAVAGWFQQAEAALVAHPTGRLSGSGAAALYGLDGFWLPEPVTVEVPPSASGRDPQIRRLKPLRDNVQIDVGVSQMSVASIDETLLGLGAGLAPRPGCQAARTPLDAVDLVELAVESALRLELTNLEELRCIVGDATANRPGRRVLAQVLRQRPPDAPPTGSYLETRLAEVLRHGGIVDFDRQVELRDIEGRIGFVDFYHGGVVIEVVGKEWHLSKFNPDHARYARIGAAGYRFLPFTFDDIEFQPTHVVRATVAALRNSVDRGLPRR